MTLRMVGAFVCAMVLFAGCKSVETTSAILHNQSGRYDLAIETAQEALARNPNDAEAHFQLGISYSRLDSVGLAFQHFRKSAELDPKREPMANDNIQSNFARHYNQALTMLKDEDITPAAEEFTKATQADPRQAKGFFMLGRVYARMGDSNPAYYEKAIPNLDQVLELATPAEKHYIDALSLAGTVLAKAGKPEEAVSRFNRLVEEDPTNYRVIEKIGYDRLDGKDWRGAAVFLDLATRARAKIGAEDFNLYYNLGVAHFQYGKASDDPEALAKAVDYYQKALGLQPDEPTTTFNIVVAYVVSENWREAITWGEKYVGMNPDDANAWRLLSRSYSEVGDDAKARECAARYEALQKQKSGSD